MELYLTEGEFIGRTWLFEQLNTDLLTNRTTNRGILLLAEMGYGKTAIITQCICATQGTVGFKIRQHLVAYHICRFDVKSTKTADSFIKRLTFMLSNKFPDFFLEVETQRRCLENYDDKELCNSDPLGCLDQCVLLPIQKIKINTFAVVSIDAIDECEDESQQNVILYILQYRLLRFPKNFRFLLSSRNVSQYLELDDILQIKDLKSSDSLNIQDINVYLTKKQLTDNIILQHGISDAKGVQNFLIASNTLQLGKSNDVPTTLKMHYEHQFSRLFGRRFETAKFILEAICTNSEQLNKNLLWLVISQATGIQQNEFLSSFEKLEHFFTLTDGYVHIYHKSLYWWLTESKGRFHINLQNGHQRWADFLITLHRSNISSNQIINLAVHVVNSVEKPRLKNAFLLLSKNRELQRNEFPFHKLLQNTDQPEALELLVSFYANSSIDQLDENGKTPLFIAAAFGRIKSFTFLLDKGANINIHVKSYNNVINYINASKVSFEDRHWGYSVLDIAAQNGHLGVIEILLERRKSLNPSLSLSPKIGQTVMAVHLACKVGNIKIVKLLSDTIGKLDFLCLYYAAEKGNIELVNYLLNREIEDTCRPCNETFYWLPVNTSRVQGKKTFPTKGFTSSKYVLYDDWSMVSCESALHVAVRMNHLDVVHVLLSQKKSAVSCYDRSGRTPLIAAIHYDHSEVAKYIVHLTGYLNKTSCVIMPDLTDIQQLNRDEISKLALSKCESGSSILHVAVQFNRIWFIEHLHFFNVTPDWSVKDIAGCSPVHRAACHNNLEIFQRIQIELTVNQTCANGSTPLQSAAVCLAFDVVKYLVQRNQSHNLDIALLSTVQATLMSRTAASVTPMSRKSNDIVELLLSHGANISYIDFMKRNILHYAISNGHFDVVHMLLSNYKNLFKKMLKLQDISGQDPVKYALRRLQKHDSLRYSTHFTNTILSDSMKKELRQILSPPELSIFEVLDGLQSNRFYKTGDFEKLRLLIVETGSYELLIAINRYVNKDFSLQNNSKMIRAVSNTRFSNFVVTDFIFARAQTLANQVDLMSHLLHRQDVEKHIHILPVIIRHFGFYDYHAVTDNIIIPFFRFLDHNLLTNTVDSSGFNIYESCIQSGNHNLLERLHEAGVRSKKKLETLIYLAAKSSKKDFSVYLENTIFIIHEQFGDLDYAKLRNESVDVISKLKIYGKILTEASLTVGGIPYRQGNNSDLITVFLLRKYRERVNLTFLCCENCVKFSFVHIAAINGLSETLQYIARTWGPKTLQCMNKDHFVPLYLAKAFPQSYVEILLEKKYSLSVVVPKPKAERIFLFNMLSRFSLGKQYRNKLFCFLDLQLYLKYNDRKLLRALSCLRRAANYFSLTWPFQLSIAQNVIILRLQLKYFFEYLNLHEKFETKAEATCKLIMRLLAKIDRVVISAPEMKCLSTDTLCNISQSLRYYLTNLYTESEGTEDWQNVSKQDCYDLRFLVSLYSLFLRRALSNNGAFKTFILEVQNAIFLSSLTKYVLSPFLLDRISAQKNDFFVPIWLWDYQHYRYMDEIKDVNIYKDLFMWDDGDLTAHTNFTKEIQKMVNFNSWNVGENWYN